MSQYTIYNVEGEQVKIMSKDDEKDSYLSLAYRELVELPRDCIVRLEHIRHLDLSNNKFSTISDLRSLHGLSGLISLVLDNNEITSHTVFPSIPNLQVLWINKNQVSNLPLFMERITAHFPQLHHLSMMDNPAAPSYFNGGSRRDYSDFRHFVISHLPKLVYLDDTAVTRDERAEALKIYGRRKAPSGTSTMERPTAGSSSLKRKGSAPAGGNQHRRSSQKSASSSKQS